MGWVGSGNFGLYRNTLLLRTVIYHFPKNENHFISKFKQSRRPPPQKKK